MDGYQSGELFDESPLQTSCSSNESGESEPEDTSSSWDKHMEFMRNAFRAKHLDSARTKTNSSSSFLTPARPRGLTRREDTSTASKRTFGLTGRTPGSTGRTPEIRIIHKNMAFLNF